MKLKYRQSSESKLRTILSDGSFIPEKVVNLKFWDLLQIFIACISPRTNEGIRTTDLMTNVLDEFDQKGYLEVALERMAYQKALGCPGWQLLLPVTDALARNGIDPKKIELKVLKITEFNPESLKSREFKVTLSFEID